MIRMPKQTMQMKHKSKGKEERHLQMKKVTMMMEECSLHT